MSALLASFAARGACAASGMQSRLPSALLRASRPQRQFHAVAGRRQARHAMRRALPHSERRLMSSPAEREAAAAAEAAEAGAAGTLPWWVEGVPYVSAVAAAAVAYLSTAAELDADEDGQAQFAGQLAITAERVAEWVAGGKTEEFRGAVLRNFSLQARLAAAVPDLEFKLGAFKWMPCVSHEITVGVLILGFLLVTPLPGVRALPRLPREVLYGLALSYAGVQIGSRYPVVARLKDLKAQSQVFQQAVDDHPDFAEAVGAVRHDDGSQAPDEAAIQRQVEQMRAQEAARLASLPPVPESITAEVARELMEKSTDILMQQTAQAVATVCQELGIGSPDDLRKLVSNNPEVVQKIYDESQRLDKDSGASEKLFAAYGIEDRKVIEAIVAKFSDDDAFMEHMFALRGKIFQLYQDIGLLPAAGLGGAADGDEAQAAAAAGTDDAGGDDDVARSIPSGLAENLEPGPALPADAPRFVPAPDGFQGSKPGYYFKKGPQGLGYYVDE